MSSSKDKRTKEQLLKLLDNALTQEELLAEKIKSLEGELEGCRKKAEDPRVELTEEALSASKVSFRLDYYRTEKNGPLKGIVEHLPSREPRPFEGEGWEVIQNFIGRYLSEESAAVGKQKAVPKKETKPEAVAVSQSPALEKVVLPAEEQRDPRLLERLRAKFVAENQPANKMPEKTLTTKPAATSVPQRSARIERLLTQTVAVPRSVQQVQKPMAQPFVQANENKTAAQMPEQRRSRLLERLRLESRQVSNSR